MQQLDFLPSAQMASPTRAIIASDFNNASNVDVMRDIARGWENFVSSGQIWALLAGLAVGYALKSITSSH